MTLPEIGSPFQSSPSTESPRVAPVTRDPFGFASAHLLGIGGAGMSAIAWALLACGVRVSGTDLSMNEPCLALQQAGARIAIGHDAANLGQPDVIVVSSAITPDNVELLAARAQNIPVIHRSDALGLFLGSRKSILVSGTHGKTTTTTLMGLLMEACGFDPWVFVGGHVPAFGSNTRVGGLEWAVAEADESDGSFEVLPGSHLIVTNIESDHLDYWKTPQAMMEGYRRVADKIAPQGIVVACGDDPGVDQLRQSIARPILLASLLAGRGHFSAGNIELKSRSSLFDFYLGERRVRRYEIGIPGLHNVSNAVVALGLLKELGGDLERVAPALRAFNGVGRRFDVKGTAQGITIVDDYAHHPTEIRATINAALAWRQELGGRLVVVFQPHRHTRTRDLAEEFGAAFDNVDHLVLTDIYSAGEPPIPGVTIDSIARCVARHRGQAPVVIPRREDLVPYFIGELREGDLVLTLGAGDITRTSSQLLAALSDAASRSRSSETPSPEAAS